MLLVRISFGSTHTWTLFTSVLVSHTRRMMIEEKEESIDGEVFIHSCCV